MAPPTGSTPPKIAFQYPLLVVTAPDVNRDSRDNAAAVVDGWGRRSGGAFTIQDCRVCPVRFEAHEIALCQLVEGHARALVRVAIEPSDPPFFPGRHAS